MGEKPLKVSDGSQKIKIVLFILALIGAFLFATELLQKLDKIIQNQDTLIKLVGGNVI
jgi:hypothetical protein